jgi:lysophospholipase L1-like esterase
MTSVARNGLAASAIRLMAEDRLKAGHQRPEKASFDVGVPVLAGLRHGAPALMGTAVAAWLAMILAMGMSAAEQDSAVRELSDGGLFAFGKPGDGGRFYVRTSRSDFAKESFQAEVTATVKGGGGAGCAFFGIGRGQANGGAFDEPSTPPSVYVRLAPSDFGNGAVTVSVNGRESRAGLAAVGDGTHRLRLTWDAAGQRALFEIDPNWNGQSFRGAASAAVSAAAVDFGDESRLFVGGANGVQFSQCTTKPLTAAEVQAAGFGENFAGDPTAGTWLAPAKGARFIEALRAGKKVTLVTMGTSLTGLWPGVMVNDWLNLEWPGQVTLFNEGMGASASSHLGFSGNPQANSGLGKLDAVIAHKPDVVFIEFGVNDAFLPYKISLADSKRNLNTMIDRILAANPATEIVLQTMNSCLDQPQPGGGRHASDRPQVAAYFQGYREVAKARGLLLVDHYPNWLKIMTNDLPLFDRLVPDRIHPQVPGLRQVLLPELKATLGPPRTADAVGTGIGALLGPLGGNLRLLACYYDGSRLAATRPFVGGQLRTPDARWTSQVRVTPVAGQPEALDLAITFKLAEGRAKSAGVAVAFDFADWSTNNYVLIPASIYNGNRNRIEYRGYCTGFNPEDFYNPDLPVTHGDVPRLEREPGKPSKLEVNASNATTPAMCFYNRQTRRAFILLAEQGIREGGQILDNGLMIEESQDRSRATLVVSAPGVRERKPEFIGFSASPDRGITWKTSKEVTVRLRVYSFASPDVAGLLDKFLTVRKAVTGPNHPRNLIPFSEVTRLMTGRIDSRWHENAAGQYYGDSNCDIITLGWVGGLMNTYPMFALGDALHSGRAIKTFDFVMPAALGKSGYFLASVYADGKASGRDWYPKQPIVLTRQNADVLYWLMKQFELLKAQGQAGAIKPEWEQAVTRLAQAFVNTWKRHGQWGNYVNHESGDIAIYHSTSGAMAIGGLALAAGGFNNPEFLTVAKEAADYYYRQDFVQKGFTYGACSDIMQNADSETAAGFMTALMALYETTGEKRWLEMSRNLANLAATWTVSYDYELPANTELAQLGAKLAGVYWASTQNKHGAPGICTSSGDALFKIYRATGDRRYAELLRDIVHAHAEGVKPNGEITERLTYCDADSRGSRGSGSTGWNELNGILMALELPGIYVRTDKDEMFVFDHVEAQVIQRDKEGVTLKIANPTRFDARVTVFTEDGPQAQRPLGATAFLKWPKVEIKAGATTHITLK